MKRLIVFTALALASLQGALYAQSPTVKQLLNRSQTERVFDPVTDYNVHFRDFIELDKAKLTLDFVQIDDYNTFRNMDSLLMGFKEAIAFYKDTLAMYETASFRIDYVWDGGATKKIRFRIHPQDGHSFVTTNGKPSKLKLEQDTVRIIIEKKVPLYRDYYEWHSIQATFILNNYTNIDDIIAQQPVIRHAMDTLQQVKLAKYGAPDSSHSPNRHFASTIYKPYRSFYHFKTTSGIVSSENDWYYGKKRQDYLTLDFNVGTSLVRNTIAPTMDLGLTIFRSWKRYLPESTGGNTFSLIFQPVFFFNKNSSGDYLMQTNGFVSFKFGGTENANGAPYITSRAFGAGYLVLQKGDYFKNSTFKVFMDLQLKSGVTLSPELIITNNAQQVFPGLTLKVF